ncbi:adenylate/guanylate cyclase domain-containing protein [Roseofilum casamattae]|uniref:Adenylate/guanylate cyclase domain-containing protein n=1 Tax=Roseofilum casamattae BLCC-M143 TaxID=3022442 RepID=A0ABT7BVT4_9CYAN|nr:adenylate/guanylate cyclase domain-containing protein [Roseofilum casamattae]MDJ1182363.1 adenylate/guanylate cyclase domain-containing protein [Roseofilum casamattae BLCC-M143]
MAKLSIRFKAIPLRLVLTIPFLLQVLAIAGLIAGLSYRMGRHAVQDLAMELQQEVSDRIEQELTHYLEVPHQVNRINADAIRIGVLDLDDLPSLERHLWYQMQQFPTVSYIGIGTETGYYVGAYRYSETEIDLQVLPVPNSPLETWIAGDKGKRQSLARTSKNNYNVKERPWYTSAARSKKPVWSEIYTYFSEPELSISANEPIYSDRGDLIAVASSDLLLDDMSEFLQQLKIGTSGIAFIVEKNSFLVATSIEEELLRESTDGRDDLERISVGESTNKLTREAVAQAIDRFGSLDNLDEQKSFVITIDGERHFVHSKPIFDERGIDLSIFVVIRELDFIQQIRDVARINIILTFVFVAIFIILGLITAKLISRPIQRLSQATKALAEGEFNRKVEMKGIAEVETLSAAFNQMADRLKSSFETLEERVSERTAELENEKEKSEKLLLNILPKAIADRLKVDRRAIAEHYSDVTILFADIVGFTPLSAKLSPIDLVNLLNQIFSAFDELALHYDLEKIKTIGDAYMVVGGLPIPRDDHAEAIANMALAMQRVVSQFEVEGCDSFQIRIGINTGPVVSGVIGLKKFVYDLWGDAVNVASRMESSGLPGQIQVTQATYERLQHCYELEERGIISVKGKGEMITYWLQGKKNKANRDRLTGDS